MLRSLIVVAVLLGAVAACSGDEPGQPSGELAQELSQRLVASAPAGYEPGPDDAIGPADLATVAQSTAVDAKVLEQTLTRAGYEGGYTRVWLDGEASLVGVAIRVESDQAARQVVARAVDDLRSSLYTIVEPFPGVAGAHRFLVNGERRTGDDVLFCNGVWLPAGRDVFSFTNCAPYPLFTGAVDRIVRLQATQVGQTPTEQPSIQPTG